MSRVGTICQGDNMLKIILISGYKRSGKDFVANKLHEQIDESVVMSFAKPLKEIIANTFNITLDKLDDYKNNEDNIFVQPQFTLGSFRTILQRFGTEAMKKHFGEDVWVDLAISKLPENGVVIFPDWRFMREYEVLSKMYQVYTIRVEDYNLYAGEHSSENALCDFSFDLHIDNTPKDDSVDGFIEFVTSLYT